MMVALEVSPLYETKVRRGQTSGEHSRVPNCSLYESPLRRPSPPSIRISLEARSETQSPDVSRQDDRFHVADFEARSHLGESRARVSFALRLFFSRTLLRDCAVAGNDVTETGHTRPAYL